MNLGNKLAVGEAVDPGIDLEVAEAPARPGTEPAPVAAVVVAPEEPVAAHAER